VPTFAFSKNLWTEIKSRSDTARLQPHLSRPERGRAVLRDQVSSILRIWVDTEQEYEAFLRFANRFQPAGQARQLYTKETPSTISSVLT